MTTDGDWLESTAEWLTPIDYSDQQTYFISQRFPDTCTWVLASPQYQAWLRGSDYTLFCRGKPGVGKTIISSTIIQDLQTASQQNEEDNNTGAIGVAYIYFDALRAEEQSVENIILSLVKQLLPVLTDLDFGALLDMYKRYRSPSLQELIDALQSVIEKHDQVFIVLDALDECLANYRASFMRKIATFQSRYGVKVFVTSRAAMPDIERLFNNPQKLKIRASDDDLRLYVAASISSLKLSDREAAQIRDDLLTRIVAMADGRLVVATDGSGHI